MEAPTALSSNVTMLKPNTMRRPAAEETSVESFAAAGSGATAEQVSSGRAVSPSLPAAAFASTDDGEKEKENIVHAVRNFNEFFQLVRRTVQFSIDEESGRTIVQVRDADTDELIRQIPSEEILRLARYLDEFKDGFKGMLLKEKV